MSIFDINNYSDFERIVLEVRYGKIYPIWNPYVELFRGQAKDTYQLLPSIARNVKSVRDVREKELAIIKTFNEVLTTKPSYGECIFLPDNICNCYENTWRLLEQIQHLGFPTRLLDWSMDAEIALYFAVENAQTGTGQFWVYKTQPYWNTNSHINYHPYSENIDIIISSSFYVEEDHEENKAEKRRGFQTGKFSFQDYQRCTISLDKQDNIKHLLKKYTINPNSKNIILEELKKKNISKESIFPTDKKNDEFINCIKEVLSKNYPSYFSYI